MNLAGNRAARTASRRGPRVGACPHKRLNKDVQLQGKSPSFRRSLPRKCPVRGLESSIFGKARHSGGACPGSVQSGGGWNPASSERPVIPAEPAPEVSSPGVGIQHLWKGPSFRRSLPRKCPVRGPVSSIFGKARHSGAACPGSVQSGGWNPASSERPVIPAEPAPEVSSPGVGIQHLRKGPIGVGTAHRRPSLRTGLAGLPHPALRLVVHLEEDWNKALWASTRL